MAARRAGLMELTAANVKAERRVEWMAGWKAAMMAEQMAERRVVWRAGSKAVYLACLMALMKDC